MITSSPSCLLFSRFVVDIITCWFATLIKIIGIKETKDNKSLSPQPAEKYVVVFSCSVRTVGHGTTTSFYSTSTENVLWNTFNSLPSLLKLKWWTILDLVDLVQFNDTKMKLGIPQIKTSSPTEATGHHNSSRSASFSATQEKTKQPRLRRASVQVLSMPLVRRRSSTCAPGVLMRKLSDPSLKLHEQQPTLISRGSIVPRTRSGSVFARGLGLPAIGLFRGRRRSRIFSTREIKIFRVSTYK